MKSTKIPCSNISTESYTGKEQSPKRFGLSAEGFDINFEKEGFDNQIWCVQIKNGRKVWSKKCNISKITHEIPLLSSSEITTSINEVDEPSSNNDDSKKKIKYYLDKLKNYDKKMIIKLLIIIIINNNEKH
jgi:hypothetical protein